MISAGTKRAREEEQPDADNLCALAEAAPAEGPSDEMDAALALSGMLSSSPRAPGPNSPCASVI